MKFKNKEKTRRHHNNTGYRATRRGRRKNQVRWIAKRLGILYKEEKYA